MDSLSLRPRIGVPTLGIDPTQSVNLVAFGGDAVWLSTDSGASWVKRTAGLFATSTLGSSPVSSSARNYFTIHHSGVYYVEPGGTLGAVSNPAFALLTPPDSMFSLKVVGVAGTLDTLYAVLNLRTIAKSVNAGSTWTSVWPFPLIGVNAAAVLPAEPQVI